MSKVYIFLADGFEEIEGLTVVDLLRRAKINISMVSITGKRFVTGSHMITIETDLLFEETEYHDADMLVLPGGMPGTNHLMEHDGLDKVLKDFNAKGKTLAAICAAPSVFGRKGFLKDKRATCYPGYEEELLGAKYESSSVVIDGNVITSRGMGTSIDFGLAIINRLIGEKEANKIASAIQYEND